jgi:type IV secretory pathway VirB3-like protein
VYICGVSYIAYCVLIAGLSAAFLKSGVLLLLLVSLLLLFVMRITNIPTQTAPHIMTEAVSFLFQKGRGFYVLLAATVTPFCSHVRQLSDKLTIVKAVV